MTVAWKIQTRNITIDELNMNISNLNKELQREIQTNSKNLEDLNSKHTAELNNLNSIITGNEEVISQKDCKIHELNKNIENLKEDLDELRNEYSRTTEEKQNFCDKLDQTSQLLKETKGVLDTRYIPQSYI